MDLADLQVKEAPRYRYTTSTAIYPMERESLRVLRVCLFCLEDLKGRRLVNILRKQRETLWITSRK